MGSSYTPTADLPPGIVFWRLHADTASVVSATWQVRIRVRTTPIDTVWGTTLDMNGDGFADVAVGSPYDDDAVYVYAGGASGLDDTPSWTLQGAFEDSDFGYDVASAGDVDGDGFADLLVSEVGMRSALFRGSDVGPLPSPDWTVASPNFGLARAAGDVDGDGFGDVVVRPTGAGPLALYRGGASGLSTTPSWQMTTSAYSLASACDVDGDGSPDLIVSGAASAVFLGGPSGYRRTAWTAPGGQVACAGDVDGDGYLDVVVGATDANIMLYRGGPQGLLSMASWTWPSPQDGGYLSVAGAGDVDADGFDDVAIGASARASASGVELAGTAYLFAGGSAGLGAAPAWMHDGPSTWYAGVIVGAGDVDGDGFEDVGISAPHATITDPSGSSIFTGAAFVVRGSATWTGTAWQVHGAVHRMNFGTSIARLMIRTLTSPS
jgi:hypothetical protein